MTENEFPFTCVKKLFWVNYLLKHVPVVDHAVLHAGRDLTIGPGKAEGVGANIVVLFGDAFLSRLVGLKQVDAIATKWFI